MSDLSTEKTRRKAESESKRCYGTASRASVACTCEAAIGQTKGDGSAVFDESRHFIQRYGDTREMLEEAIYERKINGSEINGTDWAPEGSEF